VNESRAYPPRPFLAVSAAIIRENRVLIVRRAKPPSAGLYSLPGGGVEGGESLHDAIKREVKEETGMAIEPVALAGYREAIKRDADGKVARHFVIMAFACRWMSGEPALNEELTEARWLEPPEIATLNTTDGLAEIVTAAFEKMRAAQAS
jgi:ADP-ribose pyrophosphatase YjhB (NUDIX family)